MTKNPNENENINLNMSGAAKISGDVFEQPKLIEYILKNILLLKKYAPHLEIDKIESN